MTALNDYKKEIRARERALKRELRQLEKQAATEKKRLGEVAQILGQLGVEICTNDNPESSGDELTVRQLFNRAVAVQKERAQQRSERARKAALTRRQREANSSPDECASHQAEGGEDYDNDFSPF